jgi:4-carboxymuconolactone decarboxylase
MTDAEQAGGAELVTGAERAGAERAGAERAGAGAQTWEEGMRVRREVLGDAHVDRAAGRTTPFTEPFQDLITRYAWGEIWSRPGLSRPERSMITLTALAVLRQEEELAMHVRAAVRNGLTQEQITEVLLQVAIYAGVPAANRAFAVAQGVLAELAETGQTETEHTLP